MAQSEADFILRQANTLAGNFYTSLGGTKDAKSISFWEENNELEGVCWSLAVVAFKELENIDPNEHKPVTIINGLSLYERIKAQASTDGVKSYKEDYLDG